MPIDYSQEAWKDDEDIVFGVPEGDYSDQSFLQDIDLSAIEDMEMPEWDIGYTDEGFWSDFWGGVGSAGRGLGNILRSDTTRDLLNLGSGIYGMFEADKLRHLSEKAFENADPFGPYRKQYGDQLLALMDNPESIKEMPGYQFQFDQGAEAISRKLGSKGYLGSGNMGTALVQYGQDYASSYFDREANRLARLAGADITPNQSGAIAGYGSGIDVASAALASLGYGAETAGGGGATGTGGRDVRTPRAQPGPSSAGGEAANIGRLASTAGGLISRIPGLTNVGRGVSAAGNIASGNYRGAAGNLSRIAGSSGTAARVGANAPDPSGIGYVVPEASGGVDVAGALSTAGDLYGIYAGIDKGGVQGYTQAAGSVASLAGYSAPPVVSAIQAGAKIAEGDVGGAGVGLVSAMVPIAGLGFLAADVINHGLLGNSHGDEKRNQAAWMQAFPGSGMQTVALGRAGREFGIYKDQAVDPRYMRSLMGAWYGAVAAPDGNQEYWKSEYEKLAANPVTASLPPGYVLKNGAIVRG